MNNRDTTGVVYLIGAGPGDEGLLTLKGKECLQKAEVVVYDHLVNQQILNFCGDCEKVYVGKSAGNHTLGQHEINQLLIAKAKRGFTVARLKGGDPFIFGRGGEEALELAKHGIQFEIVPGVTAATAACAYAGIPLTHRGLSSQVTFVTGHEAQDAAGSGVAWERIGRGSGTLVIYMGMKNIAAIMAALQKSGMPADWPVAVIRWGTLNKQETVTGTVTDIAERVEKKQSQTSRHNRCW